MGVPWMRAILRATKAARRNARPAPVREFLYLPFLASEFGDNFFLRGMMRFCTAQGLAASRNPMGTFNIQHPTSNIQYSIFNIEHPTSNAEHPM